MAGYDGIVVQGKSDKPVYLWITGDGVEIRDAAHLRGESAFTRESKLKTELGKSVRVLTIGPAGDNMVSFATMLASENSVGSGGLAAVMGSKNLTAIAVNGDRKVDVADRESVLKLRTRIREMGPALSAATLETGMISTASKLKKIICHGCLTGCIRVNYRKPDGNERKFMCQAALFYEIRAQRYYGEDTDVAFKATEVCDDYGLDTRAIEMMIMWLSRCYRADILTDESTGIPLSQIGSYEFIETLARKISRREGFGDMLANGTHQAAKSLGSSAQSMIKDYITKTGDNEIYGPRLYITTGIFNAVEPRFPIQHLHELSLPAIQWSTWAMGIEGAPVTSSVIREMARRFYGSEIAADFSTYDGKAAAAARIQDREYTKESLIMCDLAWPIYFTASSEDYVGDPALDSQIYSAVTGREIDEAGLHRIGERIFNLQRAILTREGHRGREHDTIDEYNFTTPLKGDFGNPECLVPGKDGEVLSRKGMVVDRAEFERMMDEFYSIRGWDVTTGLQTRAKLEELNLGEIADTLESEGLLR
jgi:aldehyde:ferredoxin oxidoreductase